MEYLIDQYVKLCLQYWKNTIEQLFNVMISKAKPEEAVFMADNFELFIRAGEAARKAPKQIQEQLIKG